MTTLKESKLNLRRCSISNPRMKAFDKQIEPIFRACVTLYFFTTCVEDDGSASYLVNNETKGTFVKNLNMKTCLWPMVDLFGKVEELAFVDDETAESGASALGFAEDDDEGSEEASRQNDRALSENYVAFHDTRGCNIKTDSRQVIAKRVDSFWNALTFTEKPLRAFDITFVEIMKVEKNYAGSLGVGVTNIDPGSLKSDQLPDNADLMMTKPGQHWRISRDLESAQGDQFSFILDLKGNLFYNKNGADEHILFCDIPMLQPLWLIFDVYGSTKTIKLMGKIRSYDPSDPALLMKYNFENHLHEDEGEKECLMCFKQDRARDCTIQPCGHLTLCHWCAITCMVKQQLRFIVCPVCGGPVKQVIRILRQTEQSSDEADGNSGD